MASFKVPESPTFNYLDLNNLQGMDSWDTNPNVMRASDMLNVVKKEGLHQVRHNVRQSYMVGKYGTVDDNDDILFDIKYVGKIEEYDEYGNTVPYYIKISEYLGEYQVDNDSRICISVWPTPNVKNVKYDLTQDEGFEDFRIEYKTFTFTNYGKSGNRQGLYEHLQFDGKERVFTPIGILSFNCSTTNETETIDGETINYKQLHVDIENVNDNPYVPTIIYGSTPDGLDYTRYEAINLLTNKRKAQFLSDGVATVYQLPEKKVSSSHCLVKELQSDGTYTELTSGFELDATNGTVTFTSAPSVSPVAGKDNIIIEYSKPPVSSEDNNFNLNCVAGDELFNANVNIDKQLNEDDHSKLDLTITYVVKRGSKFNTTNYAMSMGEVSIFLASKRIDSVTINQLDSLAITNGATKTYTHTLTIDKTSSYNWNSKFQVSYRKITQTSTTTNVPGSVGGNTSFGTQQLTCLGFSWIGLQYSAWAEAHVGSAQNGSDSYWNVYENVQLWVSRASYLQCGAGNLYGVIDGARVYAGSTGNMYGSSTVYPGGPVTAGRRINYAAGKTSVSIGAYMQFGSVVYLSGQGVTEMSAGTSTLTLPTINLPRTTTTTTSTSTNEDNYYQISFNDLKQDKL